MSQDAIAAPSNRLATSQNDAFLANAAGGRYLLDKRTQLVKLSDAYEQDEGWRFTRWPACGEASLVLIRGRNRFGNSSPLASQATSQRTVERRIESPFAEAAIANGTGTRRVSLDGEIYVTETVLLPPLTDVEHAALNWQIANGRAASASRRYFVTNQLRYMWVLTFAESRRERRPVMKEVSEFARRLRAECGGNPLAYWYSPELHPGGHGWHVNFFISSRVSHPLMESLWNFGFVWATDFATSAKGPKGEPLGLCHNPREGWRRAASYGCKYAQKDWSPEHVGRANHRYEIAQGFAPIKVSQWVRTTNEAEKLVAELISADSSAIPTVWDSNDSDDWQRPPVRIWRW